MAGEDIRETLRMDDNVRQAIVRIISDNLRRPISKLAVLVGECQRNEVSSVGGQL